jgi:hypothetical protein
MASTSHRNVISNAALIKSATARIVRTTVGKSAGFCLHAKNVWRALETEFACKLKSKKDLIWREIMSTLCGDRFVVRRDKLSRKLIASAADLKNRLSKTHDDGDELVYAFGESANSPQRPQPSTALSVSHSQSERSGTREFACGNCQYRCSTSGILARHQRLHSVERPFACEECTFRFSRRDGLVSHMRTHSRFVPAVSAVSEKDIEFAVVRLVRAAINAREEVSACSIRHALEREFTCDFRASARQILLVIQATLENDAGAANMEISEQSKAKRHRKF